MKINTKRGHCLWRGKELPELAESVAPYLDPFEFNLLFAANLQTGNIRFQSLLDALIKGYPSNELNIYYPDAKLTECTTEITASELLTYVVEDGFSQVIYIFDKLQSFLIYSNMRDSFSFWIVPRNKLTDEETQTWDAEFEWCIKNIGIGFGDEGREYGRKLLSEAAHVDARSRERFMPMLRILF